jgi:peptidyl-prolyl cis-trans isomerase A (cyclophilin A)
MIHNPKVKIHTDIGDLIVTLYADKAPVTVSNFLNYVQQKRFNNSTIFRIVTESNAEQPEDANTKIQVIQAGLPPEHPLLLPPIIHESTKDSGLSHTHGTISMARFEPGSADGSFFFCIGDQLELDYGGKRYSDGLGFAAFGRITDGIDALTSIFEQAEPQEYLMNEITIKSIALI